MPGDAPAGGAELAKFAQALYRATSLGEVERAFRAGFGRLLDIRMCGFNILDPQTMKIEHNVVVNVSDLFVARYKRDAMETDPLRAHSFATGRAAYSASLMSLEEWEETPTYRSAYNVHEMRHVVEVPIAGGEHVLGGLHFGISAPARKLGQRDLLVAEAVATMIGSVVEGIKSKRHIEQERDQALSALALTGTAVVVSDPRSPDLHLNDAAHDLLRDVVDAEEWLHAALIRSTGYDEPFSRRLDVELRSGQPAVLHSSSMPDRHGPLVTVLELQREEPTVDPALLTALSPRESEVAHLVIEGFTDREIAEHLLLSPHTVSQYVKAIYRKLNVDSRVRLTRLLLGFRPTGRAG